MSNEENYTAPTTYQIISDYISYVEDLWCELDRYQYKSNIPPYTQATPEEQASMRYELIEPDLKAAKREIAVQQKELGESDEWALQQLDEQRKKINKRLDQRVKLAVVSSYIFDKTTLEELGQWRDLRAQLDTETDEHRKATLKQEYNILRNKMFSSLPEGCERILEIRNTINSQPISERQKKELLNQEAEQVEKIFKKLPKGERHQRTDNFYKPSLINARTNRKTQKEIGAPEIGYCLKAITESLYYVTEQYGLDLGLPANTTENGDPKTFLAQMEQSSSKYVHHAKDGLTFGEIVKQKQIRHGAIIILNNKEGKPQHAMFWNGERDVNHEPLLEGFNSMTRDKSMSYKADGNMRTGAIIDIGRMIEDCNPQKIRQVCRDIYHVSVAGLMSGKDEKDLESLFIQTTGKYKMHGPQSLENEELGNSDPRLKNIVNELCKGDFPANQQIKAFLLEKGYATENNGNIELTEKLTLNVPQINIRGGCTKADDKGNVLIRINGGEMQKSDDHLAVLLGHELCHLMVNDKMPNTTTAPEVEALCDLVGLTAAKGAGYDVSEKVADNNQAYAPKALAETYKKYNSSISEEEIEKQVNKVKEMYMPKKLNKIAEFIDKEIPSRSDFWVQHAQKKLDDRKKTSSPQSTTPERKPSSGNVTKHSLSQGVNR